MFRRFGFPLAVALLAAVPAAAQDDKPVQLNIGGGYTGIYGAANDHIGNGGNFTLGVIFGIRPTMNIQGEYGFYGMKKKEIILPVFPFPDGGRPVDTDFFASAKVHYFDVNVQFQPGLPRRATPYFLAGLGVYYRPVNVTTPGVGFTTICDPYWYVCYPGLVPVDQIVGSRSSTDFGINLGGGVNYQFSDAASIFFEVRYHYVVGPTIGSAGQTGRANGQFVPITLGFRF